MKIAALWLMCRHFYHLVLAFALIVQSIGQGMSMTTVPHTGSLQSPVAASHDISSWTEKPVPAAAAKPHCQDEMPQTAHHQGSTPESTSRELPAEPGSLGCPCCDEDCSMVRCPALALGLASLHSLLTIQNTAEPVDYFPATLISRATAPPTPPPNSLLI